MDDLSYTSGRHEQGGSDGCAGLGYDLGSRRPIVGDYQTGARRILAAEAHGSAAGVLAQVRQRNHLSAAHGLPVERAAQRVRR